MRHRRWILAALVTALAPAYGFFAFVTRTASLSDEEEDVYEAVFRYQFANSVPPANMPAYFLQVRGVNPPADLLRRFDGNRPPVLAGWRFRTGAGVLFKVGNIERTGEDAAAVGGGFYVGMLGASAKAYFIVRKEGRWVVEREETLWIAEAPPGSGSALRLADEPCSARPPELAAAQEEKLRNEPRPEEVAPSEAAVAEAQAEQTETDLKRALVTAPVDGVVLQVNVHRGEYVGTPPSQALVVLGAIDDKVHVRVDVDEHDIPRFKTGAPARASLRGTPEVSFPLEFVRVERYVIPKKSLTGDNTERVDTRVLQAIYDLDTTNRPIYVGQQLDVFINVGGDPASAEETPAR
jgi:biotin carboxyl carrier protein